MHIDLIHTLVERANYQILGGITWKNVESYILFFKTVDIKYRYAYVTTTRQ